MPHWKEPGKEFTPPNLPNPWPGGEAWRGMQSPLSGQALLLQPLLCTFSQFPELLTAEKNNC